MEHIVTLNNTARTSYRTKAPYAEVLRVARLTAKATGALSFSIRAIVSQA